MFGFRPMETIVESTASNPNSNPQSPIMAQDREGDREHSLDALLQSLGRPTKDSDLFPLDLPLRSSSTSKMPSRNPSQRVREWMKRSNTVRTAKVAEAVSPTRGRHRINIAHLGGGRVGSEEIQPAITVGLTPRLVRPQRSRAGSDSAESRITQWIDLYPEAFESFSPPLQQEHNRSETSKPPPPTQTQTQSTPNYPQKPKPKPSVESEFPELDSGLRPAPLRTPTRKETPSPSPPPSPSPSSSPPPPSSLGPSRDSSRDRSRSRKRGPSPSALPEDGGSGRAHNRSGSGSRSESGGRKAPGPGHGHVRKNSKWKPLPQLPGQSQTAVENPKATTPSPEDVSAIQLVTPPLTPDLDRGGSGGGERSGGADGGEYAATVSSVSVGVGRSGSGSTTGSGSTSTSTRATARYTREERVWLHTNYRGEAPFLQAWGLDIKKEGERMEGMRMVRELMAAERGEVEGGQRGKGVGSGSGSGGGSGGGGFGGRGPTEGEDLSQGRYELL